MVDEESVFSAQFAAACNLGARALLAPLTQSELREISRALDHPELPNTMAEDLEVAFYDTFTHQVPPYAGSLLSSTGMAAGRSHVLACDFFSALEQPLPRQESTDHLGHLLHLGAAALNQERLATLAQLMDELILPALFVCARALQTADENTIAHIYAAYFHQLTRTATWFRQTFTSDYPVIEASLIQSPVAGLLTQPQTGLRQIAEFIATPGRCGVYLSQAQLKVIARQLRLPSGFGSRADLIENILHTAIKYDTLGEVLDSIQRQMLHWLEWYQSFNESDAPAADQLAKLVRNTVTVLNGMREAQSHVASSPPG